jgi:hypothetical protein
VASEGEASHTALIVSHTASGRMLGCCRDESWRWARVLSLLNGAARLTSHGTMVPWHHGAGNSAISAEGWQW